MTSEPMSSSLTAAHELLVGQVAKLTSSTEWRAMLDAARWFHDYSLRNVLLLLAQGAQGRVAGYHAWQHVPATDGRTCQVARGATGHLVLAPMHRVTRDLDHDTGEEHLRRALQGFKVVRVFDENQLVAPPAIPEVRPKVLTGMAPPELNAGLTAIVAARGFTLVERDIAPAFGRTDFTTREVAIRPGLTAAAATKTLAHEAAHVCSTTPPTRPRCRFPASAKRSKPNRSPTSSLPKPASTPAPTASPTSPAGPTATSTSYAKRASGASPLLER